MNSPLALHTRLLALSLVAIACTVAGEQVKQPSHDAAARQRFLEMFARAYFPGRTGQLLIVPREGDFITRADPNVAYMHGSPWSYDVSIPLMFAGPAVKTGLFSIPASQQDVAPTLAGRLAYRCPRRRQAVSYRFCVRALFDRVW